MATHPAAAAAGHKDPENKQVLTFELGNETYGVEILRVREIRGWTSVTKIPQAPPHVLGVLNLRGSIVPVVDLRMRFALERAEYTKVTVIIGGVFVACVLAFRRGIVGELAALRLRR